MCAAALLFWTLKSVRPRPLSSLRSTPFSRTLRKFKRSHCTAAPCLSQPWALVLFAVGTQRRQRAWRRDPLDVAGAPKLRPACLEARQAPRCPLVAPPLVRAATGSSPIRRVRPFTLWWVQAARNEVGQFTESDAVVQGSVCVGLPAIALYVIAGAKPPASRRKPHFVAVVVLRALVRRHSCTVVQRWQSCMYCRRWFISTWQTRIAISRGVRFFSLQFAMSHCTVLRRSMTSVASGKVLLLCLVPVIGWGVWCCSKKATRSHAAEVSLHNLQVCEKMRSRTASLAVLPLSSYCFLCSMF